MNDKNLEKILKAVANGRRLAMVRNLRAKKEMSVGDMAGAVKLSFRATSRHLSVLFNADLLDRRQEGLLVFYRISGDLDSLAKQIVTII